MRRLLPPVLLGLLLLGTDAAQAQPARSGAVRGRVVDAETGRPLPGAHVFFSRTRQGTAADSTGRFVFARGVPVGAQRLHASMMGYERATVDTLLRARRPYRLHVALAPAVVEAAPVRARAARDDDWKAKGDDDWPGLLDKFERLFVGATPAADSVALTNPEVLIFDPSWWGPMKAEAGAPLVFENRALGYRVRYHLAAFEGSRRRLRWDGEPLFESLAPRDSAEAVRWRQARRRAFRGSLRHFLLALLGDSLDAAGFRVRRVRDAEAFYGGPREFRTSARRLLERPPPAARDTLPAGTRFLGFSGRLRIDYVRESEPLAFLRWRRERRSPRSHQRSFVELKRGGPVTVGPAGEIVEPYGATLFGHFAFERLAALLPKTYRPRPR